MSKIFHHRFETTSTQTGCHGSPQTSRSELTKLTSYTALPVVLFAFATSTTSYGLVKTLAGRLCGKPLPFKSCFTMQCSSTEMHHCMFGSSRRKLTKLIHNIPAFHHLNQLCDNKHEHEPWGQKPDGSWATAEETAYPWPLARAIAAQVLLQLQELGVECHLPSFAEQEATLQAMRAATNIQPCKGLPPLVPEFKQVTTHVDTASLPRPSDYRYSLLT